MIKLGERIKEYRRQNRLSQATAAQRFGISLRTLIRWEKEGRNPSLMGRRILDAAKLLGDKKSLKIKVSKKAEKAAGAGLVSNLPPPNPIIPVIPVTYPNITVFPSGLGIAGYPTF